MPGPLHCVQRWASPTYMKYVAGLERLADDAMRTATAQDM
jgi:hypothetical protein